MRITTRQINDVTILDPNGKLTIGAGDIALRQALSEALFAGARNLLVNMAGVTMIDSSGIGELVSGYTTTVNYGGHLKLCSLPPRVSDILQITQLITVFEVFDSEQEAIESFA
ncbi:MAG: STAS domain-containing protein [Ardenticatenaceae bacterium]|nr:STAS domain-containing protein [Ardenticatenaceae bacterium]